MQRSVTTTRTGGLKEKSSGALFLLESWQKKEVPEQIRTARRRLGYVLPRELAKDLAAETLRNDVDEDDF